MSRANVLDEIIAVRRETLGRDQRRRPLADVRRAAADAPPTRDFVAALRGAPPVQLIAEIKRASPSHGEIAPHGDPVAIARQYERGGAACLSVLTEEHFFHGSLDDLRAVRAALSLPILRKDFVIDEYQLYESRAAGADAVLLIAECLAEQRLRELVALAAELSLAALVEFHEPEQLDGVLATGSVLVGINNRNLRTLAIDPEHAIRLRPRIPPDRIAVAESGIASRGQVQRLEAAGFDAMLVGHWLISQPDIASAVADLVGQH